MTRRIMQEFEIHEISAVDRPAQKHALATIMKRMDDAPAPDLRKVAKGGAKAALQAMRENSAAFEKMQRAGQDAYQKHVESLHARPVEKAGVVAFTKAVDAHMKANGGSRAAAMTAVRQSNPDAYSKLMEV